MDKRYAMLLEALDGTPRDLMRLAKPLSDDKTHWRPEPGQWSVAIVVAHLAYIEDLTRARFQRIVAQEHPCEWPLLPDEDEHVRQAQGHALAELIERFKAKRAETSSFLATLTQAQWLRTCDDERYGVTRLRKQVEILIGHDNEHLAQIVEIRAKMPQ